MTLENLSELSGRVRGSDPADRAAQAQNLDTLCQVSGYVQSQGSPEVAACLLAAAHALQALAGADEGLPRVQVHRSACALLEAVLRGMQGSVAPTPPAPPASPAPRAAARATPRAAASQEGEARLGRMLLRLGNITRAQLARALRLHRAKRLPIGECLLLQGSCPPELVLEVMKQQAAVRSGSSKPVGAAAPAAQRRAAPAYHVTKDMFLGEVLLGVGMITQTQLEQAMHLHHHLGLKVGAALMKIGALTEAEVARGLELQRHLQNVATAKARP